MLLKKKPILTFKHPNQYKCLIYKEKTAISDGLYSVAGVAGFEPTNVGTKSRCLTTWRHPNQLIRRYIYSIFFNLASNFFINFAYCSHLEQKSTVLLGKG